MTMSGRERNTDHPRLEKNMDVGEPMFAVLDGSDRRLLWMGWIGTTRNSERKGIGRLQG
jgi:hypothetical protein